MAKWRCSVCGYIHEGDAAPEKCPQCGVPGEKFVKLEEAAAQEWAAEHVIGVGKGVDERVIEGLKANFNGEIIITREISADGKNICRINMQPATTSVLKSLSSALIDVHGQHDSIVLQNPELHIKYIDLFGDTSKEYDNYVSKYSALKSVERTIKEINNDDTDKAYRIDMLKYQIAEIENASIEEGEEEELTALSKRIKSSENILELISDTISSAG